MFGGGGKQSSDGGEPEICGGQGIAVAGRVVGGGPLAEEEPEGHRVVRWARAPAPLILDLR